MEQGQRIIKKEAGIQILCDSIQKCVELEQVIKQALSQVGMSLSIESITDYPLIATFGVVTMPAVAIEGRVISYGKILSVEEVIKVLVQSKGVLF